MENRELELIIPTPTLPKVRLPWETDDVFSINLLAQIHRCLFSLDYDGNLANDIIDEFNYDKAKLEYQFKIIDICFHNGSKLTTIDIKTSIEHAIRKCLAGNAELSSIIGFQKFIDKESSNISGIIVKSNNEFNICLEKEVKTLPRLLADLRFSIVKDITSPSIGLGQYKVSKESESELELNSTSEAVFYKKITYTKQCVSLNNIQLNKNERYIDIFSPFAKIDSKELDHSGLKQIKLDSLKNYMIAVNPRSLSLSKRLFVKDCINRENIIENCYKNESINNNIIPSGLMGHISENFDIDYKTTSDQNIEIDKLLNVLIINGVGNEQSIKQEFEEQLKGKNIQHSVKICDTDKVINQWMSGDVDIIFLYCEAELGLDMMQFYLPNNGLNFGPLEFDDELKYYYDKYMKSSSLEVKSKEAKKLQKEILKNATVLPLFLKKDQVIISKEIKNFKTKINGPTFIKFKDLYE